MLGEKQIKNCVFLLLTGEHPLFNHFGQRTWVENAFLEIHFKLEKTHSRSRLKQEKALTTEIRARAKMPSLTATGQSGKRTCGWRAGLLTSLSFDCLLPLAGVKGARAPAHLSPYYSKGPPTCVAAPQLLSTTDGSQGSDSGDLQCRSH